MSHRKRRRAPVDYRNLICLLNQRYHREFVRAEVLEALLAPLRALRLTWLLAGLGRLRRWLARPRCVADAGSTPLTLQPAGPAGRVSLVIPFRDQPQLLRDCLASLRLGSYRDFE